MLRHANLQAIGSQEVPKCKAVVEECKGKDVLLSISNSSDKVAYMLRIVLRDKKGKLIDGVAYSDNFITIAPKGTKKITCTLPQEMKFKIDLLDY